MQIMRDTKERVFANNYKLLINKLNRKRDIKYETFVYSFKSQQLR